MSFRLQVIVGLIIYLIVSSGKDIIIDLPSSTSTNPPPVLQKSGLVAINEAGLFFKLEPESGITAASRFCNKDLLEITISSPLSSLPSLEAAVSAAILARNDIAFFCFKARRGSKGFTHIIVFEFTDGCIFKHFELHCPNRVTRRDNLAKTSTSSGKVIDEYVPIPRGLSTAIRCYAQLCVRPVYRYLKPTFLASHISHKNRRQKAQLKPPLHYPPPWGI
ncbi:unnamed protein product [Trichogramma brassicae]|uniref:Uncharacterized protein n=1 Tax=Trichogramma brassicae TaxID=86971 RepID=A0A6H5J222_9HYME|nr:unnamed protein product [Trichogramma brassicae]